MTPGRTGVDGRSAKDVLPICVYPLSCEAASQLRACRACLQITKPLSFFSASRLTLSPVVQYLAIRIQDPDPVSVFRPGLEGSVLTCRAEKLAICLDALVNH